MKKSFNFDYALNMLHDFSLFGMGLNQNLAKEITRFRRASTVYASLDILMFSFSIFDFVVPFEGVE